MAKKSASIAKITYPRITGVFPRKRIFHLMDTGLDYPVTRVSASAGSGKTTLVASYLAARKFPFLWYQVDEGDADTASFFYYMGMAAKKAFPGKRNISLPLLTPEYLHNISIFNRKYFETLYSALRTPFIIVFDNYQDVPADSIFHEMLIQGLDIIPEGVHVVAISRMEPPSQLARLCANNRCNHIGWNEIRFNIEEFKEVIRMKMPEGLTDETVSQLYAKTEVWAAGLVLIIESARTEGIDNALPGKLTPGKVFDYFANEVFKKTDRETQIFLLKTSVLPRTTTHMAETLTGMSASGRILSRMNQSNYFTSVHHQSEHVYQYHPLFREFLFSRVKDTFTLEELSTIQKNAAVILEESGLIEDAAIIFRDTRDWDSLVRLILKHAESLIKQGRLKTLVEWLTSIHGEIIDSTPWLLYWLSICRLPDNPTESRNCFDRVFEQFRSHGEQTGMWLSWSYAVDTFFHEFSNFSPLDGYISVFKELYQEGHVFSTPEVEFRVISCRFISMMLREQYHPEIGKWAGRTLSLLRECKDVNLRLTTGYYLAVHYMWIGDFTNAGVVMNAISEGIQTGTILPLERLLWETTKAMYAWLTGDILSCLKTVSDTLKLADETGVHIWDHHLLSHGVCASLSAGDIETSADLLSKIEPGLVHTRKIDIGFYHFLSAWKDMICGNLSSAAEHMKISVDAVVDVDTYLPIAVARVTMSQVLAAMGKYGDAFVQLKLARQIGHRAKSNHIKFMCLLTDAHFAIDYGIIMGNSEREIRGNGEKEADGSEAASYIDLTACGDKEEAEKRGLEVLREAMSLGREQNLANCFGWRPDVMPRLCVKALEAGIEVTYVQHLIRTRHLIPDTPPLECENWPWPLKVFTLGRFTIVKEDTPTQFSGKVQRKPLELLKAIISLGGIDVPEDRVTDLLWPDTEGDLAHQSFETTLHRLRRLLGNDMAIKHQGGQLTLDARYCWVDTWAFERLYEQIESLFKSTRELETERNVEILKPRTHNPNHVTRNPQPDTRNSKLEIQNSSIHNPQSAIIEALRLTEKATGIYKGSFLPSDTGYLWSISARERLRNKFIRLMNMIGNYLERRGYWQQAMEHFQMAVVIDDLVEEFYQHLMICYYTLGQKAEAVKVYNRCCTMLSKVLGISPSQKTEDIYHTLI